jgi:hypothetical protein
MLVGYDQIGCAIWAAMFGSGYEVLWPCDGSCQFPIGSGD